MGKIIKRENFRVVVYPKTHLLGMDLEKSEYRLEKECEEIASVIKGARVECDYNQVCSFCGSEWETEEDGCPMCCRAAVDEWEKSKVEVK